MHMLYLICKFIRFANWTSDLQTNAKTSRVDLKMSTLELFKCILDVFKSFLNAFSTFRTSDLQIGWIFRSNTTHILLNIIITFHSVHNFWKVLLQLRFIAIRQFLKQNNTKTFIKFYFFNFSNLDFLSNKAQSI